MVNPQPLTDILVGRSGAPVAVDGAAQNHGGRVSNPAPGATSGARLLRCLSRAAASASPSRLVVSGSHISDGPVKRSGRAYPRE